MKTSNQAATDVREVTAEAIRAWHRGEKLSEQQQDLVFKAGRACLARAHGVDL